MEEPLPFSPQPLNLPLQLGADHTLSNKLKQIQTNKELLERKIQEYEQKLRQEEMTGRK